MANEGDDATNETEVFSESSGIVVVAAVDFVVVVITIDAQLN